MKNNNNSNISISTLFNPLITTLTNSYCLFSCSSCNQYLFNSAIIKSIIILSSKHFCYCLSNIMNPKTLVISNYPQLYDDFLQIEGTQYYDVSCIKCNEIVGHLINLSSLEKQFLCDSILIRNDKVKMYQVSQTHTYKYKCDIDLDKVKETAEYIESSSIKNELQILLQELSIAKDYIYNSKEIFQHGKMFQNDMNKILEVIEYIKYLANKNNS